MPKEEIDYSNTIIYKIVCKNPNINDVYVGHTTNFIQRKYSHKIACNSITNNIKIYNIIRENGGWDNWDMIEIAKYNEEFNRTYSVETIAIVLASLLLTDEIDLTITGATKKDLINYLATIKATRRGGKRSKKIKYGRKRKTKRRRGTKKKSKRRHRTKRR